MRKIWLLSLCLVLLPGARLLDQGNGVSAAALTPVTFQPTSAEFPNPERGFYVWTDLGYSDYSHVRVAGNTLTRFYFRLDAYRNTSLPQTFLNQMTTAFQKARSAGIKIIPRFSYNFGPYPNPAPDATRQRIEQHLQQLAPVLAANEDVISSVEAGFIGAWGEWHSSTNGLNNDLNAKASILNAILNAVPPSRMVALRYPSDMQVLNGPPISSAQAFSGTNYARIGSHQDCFLASADDWGTWGRTGNSYASDKAYVAANGMYSVVGGETCNVNPPRSNCPTALSELAYMHWSYLNEEYEPSVIQGFKNQGCFAEIKRRLGYRYELVNGSYSGAVQAGGVFQLNLQVINRGFAALFNARPVFAVLSNGSQAYTVALNTDPRRWEPGVATSISDTFVLPVGMPPGTYTLALWLPDEAVSIRDNPLYAIRFANQGVWDASRGYNIIASSVTVTPSSTPTPPPPQPPPPPPPPPTPPPSSVAPTSHWAFDEGAGAAAFDATGGGMNGALVNGASWTTGTTGAAVRVDGVNDYVNVPDHGSLEGQPFSVSLWVKRDGAQNDWVKIISKGRTDAAPWASYKVEFDGASDTVVRWHIGFTDGTAASVPSQAPLVNGQWAHVVGTFDATGQMKLYVDGVLQGSTSAGGKTVRFDTVPLTIGGVAGGSYFKGSIDDVKYFSVALSATEVGDLFAGAPPAPPPAPPASTQVFFDSFEISEWNGLWSEDSQNDWFRSAQRAVNGSRSAEVDGMAGDAVLMSAPINLQGKKNATITLSWSIGSGLDAGEYLSLEVSTNNAATWAEKARLSGNVDQEDVWHNLSVALSNISSLRLRFKGRMSTSTEYGDVDMVRVVAQ